MTTMQLLLVRRILNGHSDVVWLTEMKPDMTETMLRLKLSTQTRRKSGAEPWLTSWSGICRAHVKCAAAHGRRSCHDNGGNGCG